MQTNNANTPSSTGALDDVEKERKPWRIPSRHVDFGQGTNVVTLTVVTV